MIESGYLNGIRVITTNMITKDMQARKHKKKRINKKWLKRYGYKCAPDNSKVLMTKDAVFMTKGCYQKLKKYIDNGGNAGDFIRFQKCYKELTRK